MLTVFANIAVACLAFQVHSQTILPVGHLRPLGGHRPPNVHIDEFTVETAPHPKSFWENYVKPSKAAIFRGAMKNTKAFKEWTDEFIRENYGDLEVRLEGKKEKVHMTPVGEKYLGRDTLRHFIDHYHDNDSKTYIVSELPRPMHADVGVLPSLGACGLMGKRFVEIDLWWSGGGSSSVIHKDAFNQINCLYRGTKYWKMFEHKYEKWIYKHWEPESEVGGFSDINVAAVDLIKQPDFVKVPWSNFTINAGDCLFLPKSYYHQVESNGPNNLAVSILFGRFDGYDNISTSDCTPETDYKTPKPLGDFDVMWKWSGSGIFSMGRSDFEEQYRPSLLEMAKQLELEGKSFTPEMIQEMFGVPADEDDGKLRETDYEKALSILDLNGDKELTSDEVERLTWDDLRNFGNEVEFIEPSNGLQFEYSFISYDSILPILERVLELRPKITRAQWKKVYTQRLHGTADFANEIFTKLSGSEDVHEILSDDITKEMLDKALENWIYYWAPQYSNSQERPGVQKGNQKEDDESHEDDTLGFGDSDVFFGKAEL